MKRSLNPITLELRWQVKDIEDGISVHSFQCLRWVINAPELWEPLMLGVRDWKWPDGFLTAAPIEAQPEYDVYHCEAGHPFGAGAPILGKDRDTGAMMMPINLTLTASIPRDKGAEVWEPPMWGSLERQADEFERALEGWGAGPALRIGRVDMCFPTHWSNVALREQGAWRAMAEGKELEDAASAASKGSTPKPSL